MAAPAYPVAERFSGQSFQKLNPMWVILWIIACLHTSIADNLQRTPFVAWKDTEARNDGKKTTKDMIAVIQDPLAMGSIATNGVVQIGIVTISIL